MRLPMLTVGLLSLLLGACKRDEPAGDGPPPQPEAPWPDWVNSHWVWEDESTQASATALVDDYLARDIPVGAIIIDSPWATGYSTYEFDPALFPDPQGFVDDMHSKGVRVLLWTVPAINVDEPELYQYAADRGWFMEATEGGGPGVVDWWKGDGSLIDYWNPEAMDWWHGLIDPALELGIDGWKCDGLDFSALLVPYSPGAGRRVERLEYSHAYYRDFHDYTRDALGDDRIVMARPIDNYGAAIGGDAVAFAPKDINWAAWVGDQDSDFEGLKAALLNMYWSADYGYVAFGSDIGGYREDGSALGREKEPFLRWAQLGAFTPLMENGGGGDHRPWMFDTQTEGIYRDFVDMHMALGPYFREHGAVAFADGVSLMQFENNETYEYLLGPDLFIAPMIEPGTQRTVTLPEGQWEYLFDRTRSGSGGDELVLDVPLEEFPVFVRKGADVGI